MPVSSQPPVFENYIGERLHMGVCGSIAAYKSLELLRYWQKCGASVGVTLTAAGSEFIAPLSFEALGADPVLTGMYQGRQTSFDHLFPAQRSKAMIIAPATAGILAKMAHGLADDILSCQALAFDRPLAVAPAMNHRMWNAPATEDNRELLVKRGVRFIEPAEGKMACDESGQGRLASLEEIALYGLKMLTPQDLSGKSILVDLGPTREYFDCVRFWSNPSTGKMGAALAVAAWLRGADVTAVCGPCDAFLPAGIRRIDVVSADEMYDACLEHWPTADIGCMTAAVADFAPVPRGPGKFRKSSAGEFGFRPEFAPTKDILKQLGKMKRPGRLLIGFAAESTEPGSEAEAKLKRKNLDMTVGNNVTEPGSGFGFETNRVTVVDSAGRKEHWPQLPKTEVAWRIWDWACRLLA